MNALVIRGGTVVTWGESCRVLPAHTLLVRKGKVERIVPTSQEPGGAEWAGARLIDARGQLVLPGFINSHMHFYSTFARGLTKAAPSANFNEVLHNLWWRLDRALTLEDCRLSALIPLLDAIRSGTTTLIDHHASPNCVDGSLDAVADAVETCGLRASLCYEVSDRDGAEIAAQGIAENIRFARKVGTSNPFLKAIMGLHASFTLSEATLEKAASQARSAGMGVHVHTAEAESDQLTTEKTCGQRVVPRFSRHKLLGEQTICAHGVHLTPEEWELLADSGTALVHNPQSNMNNAVGAADVLGALQHRVLVGLGTDAMTVSMGEEVRAALWLQRLRSGNPSAGFLEMTGLLLQGNARIAERQWKGLKLGTLQEGGAADLILLPYSPPTPLDATNILGHFVFGMTHIPVQTTIVGGRVLMHRGVLELPLDEEAVRAQARTAAKRLWDRM